MALEKTTCAAIGRAAWVSLTQRVSLESRNHAKVSASPVSSPRRLPSFAIRGSSGAK